MLTIIRSHSNPDKFRKYKIMLDGVEIGAINRNETKSFDSESGDHVLQLKIDWGKSNALNFTQNTPDQELKFEVTSPLRGWKTFLAIFYATILFNKYLILKQIT
jgi:hypothetical protein